MAAALGVRAGPSAHRLSDPFARRGGRRQTVDARNRPRADAIVTRTPRLAIGVSTADCGPLLFADAQARVIGAAHAGWRGAFTGVIEATIAAMEKLGADRSRIIGGARPHHQPAELRSRARIRRALSGGRCRQRALLRAVGSRRPRHVRSYRLYRRPHATRRHCAISRISACALLPIPSGFSVFAAPPSSAKPDYGRHINAIALDD